MINGHWHIVRRDGFICRRRWTQFFNMAKHANRVYGLNSWTYQWEPLQQAPAKD